ncbi:ribonuclease Z [Ruoffia tabacinasalis]|uniref:Ribonuclease Z n=1 Tax=Ruoffia tabacinasalis TaxID=87458 RepID=A0A5R9EI02_9LACT|nr:ribonuclease Z [Ruoffia tabacinasalis]MBG9977852.1 ribonuclease Z [Ruoffia tabacinasalis]TLQ48880.1 ribonuclease Z [Ruoffia tabacinasalis]HJG48799.1 ribonuclease Z [Ruoffia tabacinasalis]
MEILFLGTGAGVPSKSRNVSSLVLKLLNELNETWLFDCGEGTQHQILKTTLKPGKVKNIFITHMHGDHIFGLPGFLSSRSFQGGDNQPITIYGPPGIEQYINASLKYSKSNLLYKVNIVELDPKGGELQLNKGWKVKYLPLQHNVLSFGYRIEEPKSDGVLLVEKLKEYNIPNGPIFGKLKNGETVTLEDGTELDGKDFVGEAQPGKVIAIIGDTRPNANIGKLAEEADVLVHEGTHAKGENKMANRYFHSTVEQAAQVAKQSKVKQLYLNHISSRYLGADVKQLEKDARSIFKQTKVAYDLNEFEI